MARQLSAVDRIKRAQEIIQSARDLPVPAEIGKLDLTYMAEVKDLLQQARDLVKFIQYSPSATDDIKSQALEIIQEANQANQDIFR